jgi:hypothetical protein
MSWTAKTSLVLICTLLASVFMYEGWYQPQSSKATISTTGWTTLAGTFHTATGAPTANVTLTGSANTGRVLVVALTTVQSTAAAQSAASVTYNGATMVQAAADSTATSTNVHTSIYYLTETSASGQGKPFDSSSHALTASITGGTVTYADGYYALLTGVDQSNPLGSGATPTANRTAITGSSTDSLTTGITVNANEQAVIAYSMYRSSSSQPTISAWPSAWTVSQTQGKTSSPYYSTYVGLRGIPASNQSADTCSTTVSSSSAITSMSAVSFRAILLNTTTPGTATAKASGTTRINVTIPYTDDSNGNNTAYVEWQTAGSGLWNNNSGTIAHSASPYLYTITGLSAATSYDVRVTWNDPDGTPQQQTITSVSTGKIDQLVNWTKFYDGTANSTNTTTNSFAVPAATARALVVGVSTCASSSANGTDPTVSYGGVALTKATDNDSTSGRSHTWLYYLPENAIMDGSAHALSVTFSSGSFANISVYYGVFSGVDPGSTVTSTGSNNNSSSSATAAFTSALTVNAYDQALYISNIYNQGGGAVPSYTMSGNWASSGSNTGTEWKIEMGNRSFLTTGSTTDTAGITAITPSSRTAMSGISLKAYVPPQPGTNLANGVPAGSSTVCPVTTNIINNFTLINTNTGSDSVSDLTVTSTNGTAISTMSVWNAAGTTQYFTTLLAPTSGSDTWKLSGGTPIPVTNASASYQVKVTYKNWAGLPAGNTATTAVVSGYTCTDASYNTNTVQGTVTANNSAPTLAGTWRRVSGSSIQSNAPAAGDYVLVVRYTANTDATMPINGTTYAVGNSFGTGGTVANISAAGSAASFTDAVPSAGTYYYRFFEYNSCTTYATTGSWSTAVTYAAVTSASPSALGQGVTKDVFVNGAGFVSGSTVTFSNAGITLNGSATYISSSQLKQNVTVSASATGTSTVTVASSGNPSVTSSSLLTIGASPTLSSAAPNIPQAASSFPVTITGTGFQNGATVSISGGDSTVSTSFVSSTQLTATITLSANAALGNRDVTVINPDFGAVTAFGAVAVIQPLSTTPGTVSFTQISTTGMTVQVAFTGDSDGDNSCSVTWGESNGSYPNIVPATRQGSKYVATLTGLSSGADGAGKIYYFKASFSDADGVTGANPVFGASSTKGSPLNHNSLNLGSDKWPQGWGVQEGKYGAFTCSTCHNRSTSNIKMIAGSIQSPSLENWSSVKNSSSVNVSYLNPALNLGNDASHATSTNVCEVCHSRTDHHRYNNAGANHMGTQDCTPCHSHKLGFAPDSDGGQNCVLCHATLNSGAYHHDLSSTAACLNCHADHNVFRSDLNGANTVGRAANLRADASVLPVAGAPATQSNTDFNAAAPNGGLCVSCHLISQTKPDTTQTAVVAKADFAGSAHNFTVSSSFGRDNSTFLANCSKCHGDSNAKKFQNAGNQFSTHGSAAADILAPLGDPAPSDNGFCYRCHSKVTDALAGTLKPSAGYDYYGAATMGRDAEGIYGVFQKTGSAHNQTNLVNCSDCHSTHGAKSGAHVVGTNFAGPPLNGVTGAKLAGTLAAWTSPTAASFSSIASVVSGTDLEASVCFKCHTAASGSSLPASPSGGFTMTDVAKEFNPSNAGFHPVLAAAGGNQGAVNLANLVTTYNSWSKAGRNLMTCSDCHGSDSTTDPSGPHGSASKFLLRGPNTKWDGTLSLLKSGNANIMPAGTFCANCHSSTFTSSRYSAHTDTNHSGIPCLNCHAAIPHGGPRMGILVSPAGADASVGGTISGWDTSAPYSQSSGSSLYINSYPAAGAGWSKSNCGCNKAGSHG